MCGQRLLPIGLITGLTFLVYAQSLSNAFVRWDDSMLIYENPIVREISFATLKRAFTTYDPELYVPLTFLSYQIDHAVGGMRPFIFHLTNLVLHILNAILVFFLFSHLFQNTRGGNTNLSPKTYPAATSSSRCRALDAEAGPSGHLTSLFAALLFALHPLHTEAVAWASARKDVLSTFFFLTSIVLYLYWRGKGGEQRYWGSVFLHLFGLLSKVMTLTLPVVLLLVESSQLAHLRQANFGRQARNFQFSIFNFQFPAKFIATLPYFLLSIIFGIVGLLGKQSALGASTFWEKFLMAPKSAVFYLEKLLWPSGLSVLYPYTGAVTIRSVDFFLPLLLFLLLIGVAALLWFQWRRASIGLWFFLITVVPTFLNFAKGGDMDRYFASDRYAYIPSIGIFLFLGVVIVAVSDRIQYTVTSRWTARLGAALCIFILGYGANAQAKLWGNTELLLQNVLRLYGDSSHVAHNNMGNVYRLRWELPRAIEEYKQALTIRPHSKTLTNLGATYRRLRRFPEAVEAYRKALEINPKNPEVHAGLGIVYAELGDLRAARETYTTALELNPIEEEALINLGTLAMREGNAEEALTLYRRALEANPYSAYAHFNIGVTLQSRRETNAALQAYRRAGDLLPTFTAAHINLALLLHAQGERKEAVEQFRIVLRYDPANAAAREALRQMGVE